MTDDELNQLTDPVQLRLLHKNLMTAKASVEGLLQLNRQLNRQMDAAIQMGSLQSETIGELAERVLRVLAYCEAQQHNQN